MMPKPTLGVVALLTISIIAAGCGESKDKSASQTAAKVNGDEVTVHQINAELQRASARLAQANTEEASKRVLEGLIDQTLLLQQAKEDNVDRDPQVLQALESSRRQILAQAYIDRLAAAAPPTQAEIKDFYAKNPDLFERRRIYAFREFLFERSSFTDEIRNQLNDVKNPADVAKVLNAAGIKYRETNNTRPAEALPIEALPKISKMAKGDTVSFTDQNLANVLMLLNYTEQPIALERATPLIQQFLINQKKREIAQSKVKELRARGNIEYVGSFAKSSEETKAADVKLPAAPAQQKTTENDHIQKGLSGMGR